ncbi:UNVERIFIED_CONTAM: hypothetical protein Sradi_5885100 [Sesamum radiatum]|uniref:Uncharacterized protein n=1 Tax=Sesamum radiatum TaxID=300843 RepID=A0AAW2KV61_SESRA
MGWGSGVLGLEGWAGRGLGWSLGPGLLRWAAVAGAWAGVGAGLLLLGCCRGARGQEGVGVGSSSWAGVVGCCGWIEMGRAVGCSMTPRWSSRWILGVG